LVDKVLGYKVKEILDSQVREQRKEVQFLLKWKGYPLDKASWEPEANVKNSPDFITKFYQKHLNAIKANILKVQCLILKISRSGALIIYAHP